jgi:plastocyanin
MPIKLASQRHFFFNCMNNRYKILIAALAIALASTGIRGRYNSSEPAESETPIQVSGEVKLWMTGSSTPLKDASKVVIWLKSRDQIRPAQTVIPQKYRMVQRNKMFEPTFLVVPVGSLVDFPNMDPWFHNVFSLYQGKRFDLGLYEAGAHKEIRFDREGASYIFCNIHPEMAAVIMTVDSEFYGVSDKTGRVLVPNVPAGDYLLRVWYDNATSQALSALDRPIHIDEGSENIPTISVPVTPHSTNKHKNKYGHDYDSKPGATDYEN